MLVQWHDIHLAFPDKPVLEGVSLTIHLGDRIALIGENGAGKTCLFRLILGELAPDRGEISTSAGVRIGYLEQTLIDVTGEAGPRRCIDVALDPFAALQALERRIAELHAALGRSGDAEEGEPARRLDELGEAQRRFESEGGYTYRSRTEATLAGLGLPAELWVQPVAVLSAGQKVRLALARLLLSEYDLLLLDEPTNHLDLSAREWLEEALARVKAAYVVVSHDRRFLDHVAKSVAHLDRGKLTLYHGNYSAFQEQVARQRAADWRVYDKRQKRVRQLQKQALAYRNWAGAREKEKRGAADKGYVGHKAAKLMKKALVAQRRLEETIEAMQTEKPFEKDAIAIDFQSAEGRRLLSVRELSVGYDAAAPLARGIDLELRTGDRVAVVGPNGSGKTTLLRTLIGEVPPLSGEIRWSSAARPGYFDQENRRLLPETTALAAVLAAGKDETLVRTVMGRMRVQRETVRKPVGSLSAGERAKVYLARLILGEHNVLVLDEPTNHLDIETQDTLLDALVDFPGAILFVSHDRHFIETLAEEVLEM